MAVTNAHVATARGKVLFGVKETGYNVYNSAVYTASNAIHINEPAQPKQPLRLLKDRQQRNSFSRFRKLNNRYGIGSMDVDVYIKPVSLGVEPHGDQLLEGWYGKKTVVAVTSVKYEPLAPDAVAAGHPSYTYLVKYGHKVHLLTGVIVKTGSIEGRADDSDNVYAAFIGNLQFARKYWVGKDEIAGVEATGQTVISVKDATKFVYGFSASPAVGMKVAFRTVAGVLDDNSGAGYTLSAADTGANTITISPGLAGAGLAANDEVFGFVPTATDVGEPVGFHLGSVTHGTAGTTPWTIVSYTLTRNNNFMKILDFETNGSAYPTRKVDAGGNDNLREVMAEIEFVMNEDDTGYEYVADQQLSHIVKAQWGTVAGSRMRHEMAKAQMDAPDETGDEEIHSTIVHNGYASGSGENEDFLMFD